MKPQDNKAAEIEFGIEIETQIPLSSGISVGSYHRGNPVVSGNTGDGQMTAPVLDGKFWRADCDGSIRYDAGYQACEFVSPILKGERGIENLRAMIEFLTRIGAKVNASCGCHITVGVKSVIGASSNEAVSAFIRKLAVIANRHAWALYAQTGTDRHTNSYAHTLHANTGDIVNEMNRTSDISRLQRLACDCGRGMVNFQKAFRGDEGCIEFRVFAGTLNESKILHHLASVLGLCRRASEVEALGGFNRKASKKHSKIVNAVGAVRRMWRLLGWSNAAAGREVALGLFGALHSDFSAYRRMALKMARQFETRFPNANL